MTAHKHGGRIFEAAAKLKIDWRDILDFSANINPLGQVKGLKTFLFKEFESTIHYPDVKAESLTAAIAAKEKLNASYILPGAGTSPHLFLLCRVLSFKKPVIIGPAFAEYEGALRAAAYEPEYVLTKAENDFLVTAETIKEVFAKKPDMIFLAHPANPTSRLVPFDVLEELILAADKNKSWLVIDEAFIDFTTAQSALKFLSDCPRLIILRSLTKIFALPGLRLAWLGAAPQVIEELSAQTEPWPLSSLALRAGDYCLAQKDFIKKTKEALPKLRAFEIDSLAALNLGKIFLSESNYILLKLHKAAWADKILKELYNIGILVRDASNFNGLQKGYLRLAIRPKEEVKALVSALAEIKTHL